MNFVSVANSARRFLLGHFWDLDQRRNGAEPTLINQTENGTKLLKE